jgi:murein L,D-transpeptidase YcbB/YkuD
MSITKLSNNLLAFILITFSLFSTVSFAQQQEYRQAVQEQIKSTIESGATAIGNDQLYTSKELTKYYKNHEYNPLWFDNENRRELINILEDSYNEGLNPSDYHIERIKELEKQVESGNRDISLLANLELLLSDATALYASHLLWGKVDQSKIREGWDIPQNPKPSNIDSLFTEYKYNNNLTSFFNSLRPQHFMYNELKRGLKDYREIVERGGWPAIPKGETLKKGMTDKRVATVREYLTITGDLPENITPENPELFDENLEEAVKNFQFRHNLTQDGVIGKGTLAQMNVPVEKRIDQIRINLERGRWVMHQLEPDFLVVNIAGFNLRRVQNDSITFFSPVIVGRKFHESPIFKGKMIYIEINPTWTVPYSIATKEMLPKLKKDPSYLSQKNMIIMDRNGNHLDPTSIDFSKYSRGNFPFIIRQEPGPHNALGQVKFIFPNKYSVYVHDTPGKYLFSREDRAFSHGCIRLEKKWELLMNLMDDPEVWNMDKINEILATKKTTRINLPKPIDIIILYWTAGGDKQHRLFFDRDVYQRDDEVLTALNGPVIL